MRTITDVIRQFKLNWTDQLDAQAIASACPASIVAGGRSSEGRRPPHQFIDALRWLQAAQPGDDLPKLAVNPDRPNRLEPRVRKRQPKEYPVMQKPRRQLKKELETNGLARC